MRQAARSASVIDLSGPGRLNPFGDRPHERPILQRFCGACPRRCLSFSRFVVFRSLHSPESVRSMAKAPKLRSGRLCLGWWLIPTVDGFNAYELRIQAKQNQHHPKHYKIVFDPPVANYHHQVKRPEEKVEEWTDFVQSRHSRFALPRQEPSVDKSRSVPTIWRPKTPKWSLQGEKDHGHRKHDNGDQA